jgi:nitrogen fixation NifU-like protein
MMDLRELYQEIILDHGRHPRNLRAIADPTHKAQGYNPLCGDRVTVYLKVEGDRIADLSFEGRGCAISTAAASLMTEILKGKTVAEARALFAAFHSRVTGAACEALLHGEGGGEGALPEDLAEAMERLDPLLGVKAYPSRIKCATLSWHAMDAALKNGAAEKTVKTE